VWGNEKRMKKRSRRERKDERGEKSRENERGERRGGEEKRNEKKRGIPSVFQFKHCLKDVFRCILVLFFSQVVPAGNEIKCHTDKRRCERQ